MIVNHLIKYGDSIAISQNSKQITYCQLIKNINDLIKKLKKSGIKSKNLLGVEIRDSIFFITAALACIEGGFSYLPLNIKSTRSEKKHIIKFTQPKAIIKVRNEKFIINKISNAQYNFKKQTCIFFTSGTTNFPKGVCHTPENLINNAINFNKLTKIKKNQNFLHLFPMYYMAGFLNSIICPLLSGNQIFLFNKEKINNYLSFWEYIKTKKINYFWSSPSFLSIIKDIKLTKNQILEIRKILKFIFIGTAPFHNELKKKFEKKFKIKCLESYGSSEMLIVSSNFLDNQYGSGKILDGIKIRKDNHGNLLISSPYKFMGYLKSNNNIQMNQKKFFNSGDIFIKKKRNIKIIGRNKDIIIKEGINISPKYIEEAILKIKNLEEAVVIGIQHRLYGEIPIAFLKSSKKIPEILIKKELEKKINKKIIPEKFIFVKSLPKNKLGKIDKKKIKELYDSRRRSFKL